jgi:predicted NUDIX family NTP pyrophosphohydrolase
MPKRSAGVLLYRRKHPATEVFLVHPGGPFWANKDVASWSVPKGEYDRDEDPLAAAKREFREETGFGLDGNPVDSFLELGESKQPGGKLVTLWALEGDFDPARLQSNTFRMEWPPRSGRQIEVPEVDRGCWFPIDSARAKLHPGQVPFLERLHQLLVDLRQR